MENQLECGKILFCSDGNLQFYCLLCRSNFHIFMDYEAHLNGQHCQELKEIVKQETIAPAFLLRATNDALEKKQHVHGNTFAFNDENISVNFNMQALGEHEVDIATLKETNNINIFEKINDCSRRNKKKRKRIILANDATTCPICKEVLSKNTHLKTHMRRHNINEKNFGCSTCSKAFFTRCELETHIRSHTGERPYLCTTCGKAFTTASKLSGHISQRHARQLNKSCSICKMSFHSNVLLKNHMITHSDEKPFGCKICSSKFKRHKGLKSHMKMHENKKEHECDLCPAKFNQKSNLNAHRKNKHAIVGVEKLINFEIEMI